MQYFVVFSICFGILLAEFAGDSLSSIDDDVSEGVQILEDTVVHACETFSNQNIAAAETLQDALLVAIKNNSGLNPGGELVADVVTAVTQYVTSFTKTQLPATIEFVSVLSWATNAFGDFMRKISAALDSENLTPDQKVAWIQEKTSKWTGIQVEGDNKCEAAVAKAKSSLDAVNNRIQKEISAGIKDSSLGAKVSTYVNAGVVGAVGVMDYAVSILKSNERLNSLMFSLLNPNK